jgi:hypothetical protein
MSVFCQIRAQFAQPTEAQELPAGSVGNLATEERLRQSSGTFQRF